MTLTRTEYLKFPFSFNDEIHDETSIIQSNILMVYFLLFLCSYYQLQSDLIINLHLSVKFYDEEYAVR